MRGDLIHLLAEMENNTLLYWLGLGGSNQQEKYIMVALSTVYTSLIKDRMGGEDLPNGN